MEISKEDYKHWRDHPVTRAFLDEVMIVMDAELAQLVMTAGDNSLRDKYRVGHIKGLSELLDWDPEFIEEKVDAESQGT